MAKGDDNRARNAIDHQGGLAQNNLNNVRDLGITQSEGLWDRYNNAANQNVADYGNIQNRYQQFADTGGYSAQDLGNIRSRAMSPVRANYAMAQQGLDRQKSLQGEYMPGYGATRSRMAREQGQAGSDAAGNTEANIAQMVQQGKLAGLGGMAGMYGATPGLSSMFGNQALQSMQQRLGIEGLQGNLSLGTMDATTRAGQLPGNWEHNMKRIGQIGDIGAGIIGAF